jgi:hypothetical protein
MVSRFMLLVEIGTLYPGGCFPTFGRDVLHHSSGIVKAGATSET